MSPAKALARFAADVEKNLKITVSIGLSCNKFLAKVASDLDKPRGFAVLGESEAPAFLAPKPVSFIYGVGKVSAARYARDGFHHIADLQRTSEIELMRRYGEEGRRLARLARGIDSRDVSAERETKSVSSETTFERDISDFRSLERILWRPGGGSFGAAQEQGIGRRDRDAETQDRRFQDPHPRPLAGIADAAGATHFRRGARSARTRDRRHPLSPARRRRQRDLAPPARPIRPTSSTAARRRPNTPSTACAPASATTRWSGAWRSRGRRKDRALSEMHHGPAGRCPLSRA